MSYLNTTSKKPYTIFIHILLWIIFFGITSIQFFFKFNSIPVDFFIRSLILVVIFYINYSILVPKLLLNNKVGLYSIVALSLSAFIIYIIEPIIPHNNELGRHLHPHLTTESNHFQHNLFSEHHKKVRHNPPRLPIFLLTALFFALSTSIKLALEWYKKEKERVIIESQKVNSELSFLKAQLNPHFLFNTLNGIYSLANKKSDDTTEAIITLSELMRYMIYEANEPLVPLEKEINHIKNYISLQLLRIKDSSNVKINIHGDLNYKIEPLLLISFIENSFKYGTDFKGNTEITIKINIINNELHFYTYNISSVQNFRKENSGVGIENIKNRLALLYPKNHILKIHKKEKSYEIDLVIKLKKEKNEMYHY